MSKTAFLGLAVGSGRAECTYSVAQTCSYT